MDRVIVTELNEDIKSRKKRYLSLMLLRVLLVPGIIFLPLAIELKVILLFIAAVSQFVAVITANTSNILDNNIIYYNDNKNLLSTSIEKQ
jgi:hypothetical protein